MSIDSPDDLKPKRGRGRPPGAAPHRIHLRLSDGEHAILEARARACGVDVPMALRMCITGYDPPPSRTRLDPEAQRELWRQVRALGVNCNQLAAKAHSTHFAAVRAEDIQALTKSVTDLVEAFRLLAGIE